MAKLNGIVRSWSYSALSQYEKCARQYKYARIERLPQPPSPHLDRGNLVHTQLEAQLKPKPVGEHPAPHLSDYIEQLAAQKPRVEEMWYIDSSWNLVQTGGKYPNNTWLIVKMDAFVGRDRDRNARVVDWKTGRRYIDDHEQQAQLYALGAEAYELGSEIIEVDMVYVDIEDDSIDKWEFEVGARGEELRGSWTERAMRLFTETKWEATPSYKACSWCAFSRKKGGPCRAG